MNIGITNKFATLVVEPKRWALTVGNITDQNEFRKFAKDAFNRITKAVNWGDGTRIGVKTIWVESVETPFDSLTNSLKEKLLKNNKLVEESVDIALPLTLVDGECKVNYIGGAVQKEEFLAKYGGFEDKQNASDLPQVAIVADIDYYSLKNNTFSLYFFESFLNKAVSYSESKANLTKSIFL